MGGRGGSSGVVAVGVSQSKQRQITMGGKTYNVAAERKKLSDFESSMDSRFKKYEVGEATIYKVGNGQYSVYDLKRIPIDGKIQNTLAVISPTLSSAKKEAETLNSLIKKNKKKNKIR